MALRRGRHRQSLAGWIGLGAVGLGTGAAVLLLLDPRRRERARGAMARVNESAHQAGERLRSAHVPDAPRAALHRPSVLGAVLLARALLGRGLLRVPFGLLGVSALARAASGSERGREILGSMAQAVRGSAAALRRARERAENAGAGPAAVGPDAKPG